MQRYLKTAVITKGTDRFIEVCKHYKIPFEHHGLYREWLIQSQSNNSGGKLTHDQLPIGRGQRLPPHLRLPKPHGTMWTKIKRERFKASPETNQEDDMVMEEAIGQIKHELQYQKHAFRATGILTFESVMSEGNAGAARKGSKAKQKRQSHSGEPANTRDALEHPERGKQWAESMDEEIEGLTKMGVLDHGYTLNDLHQMGIMSKPVPLGLYHTHTQQTRKGMSTDLKHVRR